MSVRKRCYECQDWIKKPGEEELIDEYSVVVYPADKSKHDGEMVYNNPQVLVYLCGDCINDNQNKIIKNYG